MRSITCCVLSSIPVSCNKRGDEDSLVAETYTTLRGRQAPRTYHDAAHELFAGDLAVVVAVKALEQVQQAKLTQTGHPQLEVCEVRYTRAYRVSLHVLLKRDPRVYYIIHVC
jgi:hypothetical protein